MPSYDRSSFPTSFAVAVAVAVLAFVALIGGAMWGLPQYNLYRAETAKKTQIADARAKSDAAQYEAERAVEIAEANADADRARAAGIADANTTIAESLTDEYVRWYFVDRLDDIDGQIIYVPTEAGIPLPEASRAVPTPEPVG